VCPEKYLIKLGDKISHTTPLRHETPIFATLPKIIHEDINLIVVDKPSSMPVHPCGNFKYNSLQWIL
jgi:23S rRNA-/tRNA-specific pseudouridylate synthase